VLLAALLFSFAALLRVALARGEGLWADEFFSLAMATGHSLEHPAAAADSSSGDFVEGRDALPAGAWGRYLAHEHPPAGPVRITRAVFLSDTSPPLYYILLGYWTRALGTADAALRLFSVLWALVSLPLLWLLGRRLGGTRGAGFAVLLYAAAPISLYYSGEGRMYSLLWCLALATAWLTLRLHDRGTAPGRSIPWAFCAAAGLLTHYFFAFAWAGMLLWLWLHPGRADRRRLVLAMGLVAVTVLPWYLRVPASLAQWRVTGDWLAGHLSRREVLTRPFELAWSYFSERGMWGGSQRAERVAQVLFVILGLTALARSWRRLTRPAPRLVWLWLGAACAGPVVFDLLRGTIASSIARYALAGLPAAALLAGLALSSLGRVAGPALAGLILLAWSPAIRVVITNASRYRGAYLEAAEAAARWAGPQDLVIVHSIPSGVVGIARYLPPEVPVAAWVGQLEQRRVPDDVAALVAGRRRVALVRIHAVGAPAPELDWLRQHATFRGPATADDAPVLWFDIAPVSPRP
jgi:4-amino-4-deoxy-L-arabinose transferase-like glycosyltransferase